MFPFSKSQFVLGLCFLIACALQAGETNDTTKVKESKPAGEVSTTEKSQDQKTMLETMVVSATREDQELWQVPAAVGTINEEALKTVNPTHPSDVMGRVAGVWVNITGGEGHMTAIRQPLSTSPVYLYLENGVPTRSPGFFNHNALYEVNLPMASGIEVIKGPGSALHGSDAVGGVVNVTSKLPSYEPEANATLEGGGHGWQRGLFSYANALGDGAFRADINTTESDGWRDGTAYERRSATLQWLRTTSESQWRAMITWSDIDQDTAGSSAISEEDFLNNPETNYTPISYRQVEALRLSLAYERQIGSGSFSAIPFMRVNSMAMLPNWSLTYDPTIYEVENNSYGLMTKYATDFDNGRGRLIVGADLDVSPGERFEQRISPSRVEGIFVDYELADPIYDYDVTFAGTSGYVHGEWSPMERLELQAGLRYDRMTYDYETNLEATNSGRWRRPEDTETDYDELSPKLGLSFRVNEGMNLFASYREAFRAPSEGQLFRQGSSVNTVGLKPVKAANIDLGLRGEMTHGIRYEVTAYRLEKSDDILRFRDPITDERLVLNAGETSHEGIEVALSSKLGRDFHIATAWSYAEHFYDQWVIDGNTDYSGNEMESAPRRIGNLVLDYTPDRLSALLLSAEWRHLGSYYTNQTNTQSYEGHNLLSFTAAYSFGAGFRLQARLANLTDERYAERASYNNFRGAEFAPGLPRTLYVNLNYRWE
jgi:outer membrane receptor protein involved in Fe transport